MAVKKTAKGATGARKKAALRKGDGPVLLSGGNPQVAKRASELPGEKM